MTSLSELSEEERRALRGSKFAPLPCPGGDQPSNSQPRLAHPGGPLTTNKAAALAKFLERKLKEPGSLDSLDPELVERAVLNAKATINRDEQQRSVDIRHVDSFSDSDVEETKTKAALRPKASVSKKTKKTKKKQKQKKKARKLKINK